MGTAAAFTTLVVLTWVAPVSVAVLLFLPSIPFNLLTTHLAGYMYGGGMLMEFNAIRTAQPAVLLVALCFAGVIGRPDPVLVLACASVLTLLLAGVAVWTLARTLAIGEWRFDGGVARGLLSYALQSYVGNLCWLLNSRLDQLMMSVMLSAAALGVYATSVAYAGVVFSFFSAFAMLAFAKASALEAREDARISSTIRRYLMSSLVLGIPTALGLAVAAPWLYPFLFGAEFSAGVGPAIVLCAGGVLLGLNYILSNEMRVRNRPLLPSIAEGAGVVVSALGLTWALPRLGIVGAAWVSLASYATVLVILVSMAHGQRLPRTEQMPGGTL